MVLTELLTQRAVFNVKGHSCFSWRLFLFWGLQAGGGQSERAQSVSCSSGLSAQRVLNVPLPQPTWSESMSHQQTSAELDDELMRSFIPPYEGRLRGAAPRGSAPGNTDPQCRKRDSTCGTFSWDGERWTSKRAQTCTRPQSKSCMSFVEQTYPQMN